MKQYFDLSLKEKRQERILLLIFILVALTVGKGVYNQTQDINQDNILIPLFFSLAGVFFLVYAINGLNRGNLVPKWTPFYLFNISLFLANRVSSFTPDNARTFVTRILGVVGLLIAVGLFTFAIVSCIKNI